MVLKTFNVQEVVYGKFSHFCKEHGISMSKQVELINAKLTIIRLSDGEWGSLSFFTEYLRKQGLYPRLRRIIGAYLRMAGYKYVSEHDLDLLNHIKRPISTFRQDVFVELDNQIFGS